MSQMWDMLDNLSIFVATVRAGGIRPAAAQVELPRSTVSRRLAELERRLGVALLRRGAGALVLTDVGKEYFDRVAAVVDAADAVTREIAGQAVQARGLLRVAASGVFAEEFLVPVVERYLEAAPQVRLELHLAIDRIDLRERKIDVAFRTAPLPDDDEFTSIRLGSSVTGFFASAGYLRAHGRPTHPRELAEHDLLATGEPGRRIVWPYRDGDEDKAMPVQPRVLSSSVTFSARACAAGCGIARMPAFFARDRVASGALVPLLQPHWHETSVHAVFPRGIAAGLKIRAFVDAAQRLLATELSAPGRGRRRAAR